VSDLNNMSKSKEISVAIIATSIPVEAIALPFLAVLGELSLLIPKINRTAERTYARFV